MRTTSTPCSFPMGSKLGVREDRCRSNLLKAISCSYERRHHAANSSVLPSSALQSTIKTRTATTDFHSNTSARDSHSQSASKRYGTTPRSIEMVFRHSLKPELRELYFRLLRNKANGFAVSSPQAIPVSRHLKVAEIFARQMSLNRLTESPRVRIVVA